jgi:hypothetical protein
MLKRWLLGLGLAALLVGVTSSVVQAGVSIRLNIGVPVTRYHHSHPKRYHHVHPSMRNPRVFAPPPIIVAPPGAVHRPIWVPGRWQWTPWGWQWSGGYWVQ